MKKDERHLYFLVIAMAVAMVVGTLVQSHRPSDRVEVTTASNDVGWGGQRSGQELVWEHGNGGVDVYCDMPSFDRVYISKTNVIVVPGGCKGLP